MRRLLGLASVLGIGALLFALLVPARAGLVGALARALGGSERASAADDASAAPTANDVFEPLLGMPASGNPSMIVIGDSPREAPGEVWAYGTVGDVPASVDGVAYADQHVLVEHTEASGWQVVPLPSGPEGKPLSPGSLRDTFPDALGALGARATAAGGVVLLTEAGLVARDPGAQPRIVPAPEADVLGPGESLPPQPPPSGASTPYAAVEEPVVQGATGHTGVLIAPYDDGAGTTGMGVLHYDGTTWTREPIALTGEPVGFTPQALACGPTATDSQDGGSSPQNCWLLASYRTAGADAAGRLVLFHRVASGKAPGYVWEQQQVTGGLLGETPTDIAQSPNVTTLGAGAQMLTVTSQGVWVDFRVDLGSGLTTADVSELALTGATGMSVAGTWCYPSGTVCPAQQTLGAPLAVPYQSFAWPGASGEVGTRIITGQPNGALLELAGAKFAYTLGAGGNVSGNGGAAFSSPEEGWIGSGNSLGGTDQQGQAQVIAVTPRPQGDELQEQPVPFRYPLLALAQAPGSTPGDPGAEAIAVGVQGEVGHYLAGQGWRPETLYDAAGKVQIPTLRGVAWPELGRAYAVGDKGAMWLWRSDTGLWEPDPAKPFNFIGNLTAIAFSPSEPQLGYAVGKQGVLLRYGKSWEQVPLPPELQQVNFTSVAFAGAEALASYRAIAQEPGSQTGPVEVGGLAVQEGSGPWHIDTGAATLLAQLPHPRDTVLSKVAGLPDGGAVAAGPGLVIEREGPGASWHFSAQPLPEAQNISALGAYRDATGAVRAVASIDPDSYIDPNGQLDLEAGPWAIDLPPPTGPGQPQPLLPPDPVPDGGYLLEETAAGWSDMEHMAFQTPGATVGGEGGAGADMPMRADPVLALLVSPSGGSGLAVGGQTYDTNGSDDGSGVSGPAAEFETAAAMRFGAGGGSTVEDGAAPVVTKAGAATFAVGGEAACALPCAAFAGEGLGPDTLLTHALQAAAQIATSSPGGLRGFLYTGGRLRTQPASLGGEAFERELGRYASLLAGAGSLPVHAAASPGDLAPGGTGIGAFSAQLSPFGPSGGSAYYSFSSTGATGGAVTVIVLDYSTGVLGAAQEKWLVEELAAARVRRTPALVMGNAVLGFRLPDGSAVGDPNPLEAQDAAAVSAILVHGGASAYLFDYPGVDVQTQVVSGGAHIPAFGSGTLGYVAPPGPFLSDSLGSGGFLLLEVEPAASGSETNVAHVSARIEPNIGQLALDATDGVLLRRSQVALFQALARLPASGIAVAPQASGAINPIGPAPYEPIPFDCQGANCADEVPTEYTFSSSNPDIGNFVAHETASTNPRQVELGANELPVADPHSGLFCAYNEGTTTVSITTGGLTYSEPITVQGGSVEYPCGTVPLKHPPSRPAPAGGAVAVPGLAPSNPPPVNPLVQAIAPPPPPAAKAPHPPRRPPLRPAPFLFVPLVLSPLGARPAIVPPISPPVARPIPPSSTSQVYQGMSVPQRQRERETASELAANEFSAYDPNERGWIGPWIVPLVIIAAGAGVGIRRGIRPGRRQPAYARARAERRRSR